MNWKSKVYQKVKGKINPFASCFGGADYYRIEPKEIPCSKRNTTIRVEWLQPSYFGEDVLINYRTDNLRLGDFTEEELKQLYKIV